MNQAEIQRKTAVVFKALLQEINQEEFNNQQQDKGDWRARPAQQNRHSPVDSLVNQQQKIVDQG